MDIKDILEDIDNPINLDEIEGKINILLDKDIYGVDYRGIPSIPIHNPKKKTNIEKLDMIHGTLKNEIMRVEKEKKDKEMEKTGNMNFKKQININMVDIELPEPLDIKKLLKKNKIKKYK